MPGAHARPTFMSRQVAGGSASLFHVAATSAQPRCSCSGALGQPAPLITAAQRAAAIRRRHSIWPLCMHACMHTQRCGRRQGPMASRRDTLLCMCT